MDEIEIITEWPVIPDTDVKETKHSTSQRQKNSEFTRFSLQQGKQKRVPNDSAINLEKRCRYGNNTECLANAALAKWWRRNYTDHKEDMVNVVGCHPNTQIKMIARFVCSNYTDHREDMVNVMGCHSYTRIKMIARFVIKIGFKKEYL